MPAPPDAATIRAFRPLVPAKDLQASRRFYEDLGFVAREISTDLVEMRMGPHAFVLQRYWVKDWAENFVFHLLVDDLAAWWRAIAALDLAGRHGVQAPQPPRHEAWGLETAYVFDPAGVLWQFAQA